MKTKQFVVLRGITLQNLGELFFTVNFPNPSKNSENEESYEIIGYADTVEEAQDIIVRETTIINEALDKLAPFLVCE